MFSESSTFVVRIGYFIDAGALALGLSVPSGYQTVCYRLVDSLFQLPEAVRAGDAVQQAICEGPS